MSVKKLKKRRKRDQNDTVEVLRDLLMFIHPKTAKIAKNSQKTALNSFKQPSFEIYRNSLKTTAIKQ